MSDDQPPAERHVDNARSDGAEWTFYDNFAAFPHASMTTPTDVFAEVIISLDDPDGGTHGEFKVRWYDFSHDNFAVRIEAYQDSWAVLRDGDLLGIMRGLDRPTPNQFMQRLRDAGYKDRTASLSSPDNPCPTCYGRPFDGRWGTVRVRERVEAQFSSVDKP